MVSFTEEGGPAAGTARAAVPAAGGVPHLQLWGAWGQPRAVLPAVPREDPPQYGPRGLLQAGPSLSAPGALPSAIGPPARRRSGGACAGAGGARFAHLLDGEKIRYKYVKNAVKYADFYHILTYFLPYFFRDTTYLPTLVSTNLGDACD